jgi:8-oxo-dGTP diphosphatase
MENKIEYVLGFAYNKIGDTIVVLIKKNRPLWQKGLLNGVSGHIEINETPYEAMKREFHEETGVIVDDWENYCIIVNESYIIHIFKSYISNIELLEIEKTTDEEIFNVYVNDIFKYDLNIVPNIGWLILLGLDNTIKSLPIIVNC